MRMALSEAEKNERRQCVILHVAAAHGWGLRGYPRRPPSLPHVQTVGAQLRKAEYQQASMRMKNHSRPSMHPRLRSSFFRARCHVGTP